MAEQASGRGVYNSGHGLVLAVTIQLIIFVVAALPHAGLSIAAVPLWESVESTMMSGGAESGKSVFDKAVVQLQMLTSVTYLGANIKHVTAFIGLAAGIGFLTWLYTAHQNLSTFGRESKFPGLWVVAWWFIPFANLFLPFMVMNDIWRGSNPESAGEADSLGATTPGLVGWWWVLVASAVFVGFYYVPVSDELGINIVGGLYLEAVIDLLMIGAAVMTILVMREIDRMQMASHGAGAGH